MVDATSTSHARPHSHPSGTRLPRRTHARRRSHPVCRWHERRRSEPASPDAETGMDGSRCHGTSSQDRSFGPEKDMSTIQGFLFYVALSTQVESGSRGREPSNYEGKLNQIGTNGRDHQKSCRSASLIKLEPMDEIIKNPMSLRNVTH